MTNPELSPDGQYLAYIGPLQGRSHLVIKQLGSSNRPVVIPPGEDGHIEWLHWANPDRLVFLVSASRKRDRVETAETRLWAIDKDGGNLISIVRPSRTDRIGTRLGRSLMPAQLQGDVLHWLPDEPNHLLLALDGDGNGGYEVRKIDIRDGSYRETRNDTEGIQDWLTDHNGEVRLGWGYRGKRFRVMYKNEKNTWSSAEKASWRDAGYFPNSFTEDPNIVYMFGYSGTGHSIVNTIDLNSGEVVDEIFYRDGIDARAIVTDPLTRLPVGVAYTHHLPRIRYFDKSMDALQRGIDKAIPDTANRIVSMTADRRVVLIHSVSDTDPGTLYFLDRNSSQLSFVAEDLPGLPVELMSTVEPVSYEARDGLTIPAYITYPRGKPRENLPFVVLPHGGPASRDDRSFWFLSQFIASRGYGVLQPNFRGSSGYGRPFENAGKQEWGGKMQEDVTDGTRWLVEQGIADARRICIAGWSYGGYAAAMGAVQTPDLYQCAASINGVLNLPRLIADDRHYIGGTVWSRHVGLAGEKSKSVSPHHQAERITVPMLIIQAKDDVRVHQDQGTGMARQLKRHDKPHRYIEVELGGHSMTNEAARLTILTELEAFLAENLPN